MAGYLLLVPIGVAVFLAARASLRRAEPGSAAWRPGPGTDPMIALTWRVADELTGAGHEVDWSYVNQDTVSAACARCGGIVQITGGTVTAGPPIAAEGRPLTCPGGVAVLTGRGRSR